MSSRMPHRLHGTGRQGVEPALIQLAVLSNDCGLDAFETPSKHAPIADFIVSKPTKRSRTKKPSENGATSANDVTEDSEAAFSNEAELKEEVKLSLIDRCSTSTDSQRICPICEEEIKDGLFPFSLDCSHSFCSECWLQHVQLSIKEGRAEAGCMEPNCPKHLTPAAARTLLAPESAEIYRLFVEDCAISRRELHCPECGNAVENTGSRSIECSCGTVICSACSSIDHRPVSCSVYGEYIAARDGKDCKPAELWYPLVKHLCRCPKCGEYAEKEGRCNYITCICDFTYCRICSTPYSYNHTQHCSFKTFTVSLIDVPVRTPPMPVNPALINKALEARDLIEGRRKEISKRLAVIDKVEAAEVLKDIAERWKYCFSSD